MIWCGECAGCGKRELGLVRIGDKLFCWGCIDENSTDGAKESTGNRIDSGIDAITTVDGGVRE